MDDRLPYIPLAELRHPAVSERIARFIDGAERVQIVEEWRPGYHEVTITPVVQTTKIVPIRPLQPLLREEIARIERLIEERVLLALRIDEERALVGTTSTDPPTSGFTLEQLQQAIKAIGPAPPEPVCYVDDVSWVAEELALRGYALERVGTSREYWVRDRDQRSPLRPRLGRVLEVRLRPRLSRGWLWLDRGAGPPQRIQLADVVTTLSAIALAGVDERVGP